MMAKRSPHWQRAVQFDIEGTQYCGIPTETTTPLTEERIAASKSRMEAATQAFIKAQKEYELAWQAEPSAQLLFDYAAFCGCICENGLYMNLADDKLRDTCSSRFWELIGERTQKYPQDKRLNFLKKYIGYHFFGREEPMSEEENLEYVDPDDPSDIPYFYLYLTSGYKRYLKNARLVYAKCCKELTRFHFTIKSILDSAFISASQMGLINKPNSKYDHLFVVLRYDPLQIPRERPDWATDEAWEACCAAESDSKRIADFGISGLKAFCTLEEAEQEAERLNVIQTERFAKMEGKPEPPLYFVKWVRLKKGLLKEEVLPMQ